MDGSGEFRRLFFDPERRWTWIGSGKIGGKASGLEFIDDVLTSRVHPSAGSAIEVGIPSFTVLRTGIFDAFLERNHLADIAYSDAPDDMIAHAFLKATLPAEFLGDLHGLIKDVHTPLAVRSSSLLEDAMYQPFAGIYVTKMIPNNQPSPDVRFQQLVEAVKLVYASTMFRSAKDYIRATGRQPQDEKMAVLIQEVVGTRFGDRYYPEISGVARSYNFYAVGRARPEDGVVSLALGLGKTIVDGGTCWTYSPRYPGIAPPFATPRELMNQTQTSFWAVNMGKPPAYDPMRETEYLVQPGLAAAEEDGTLRHLASTYDPQRDKITSGLSAKGPRILNFAGILVAKEIPLNELVKSLLLLCQETVGAPVEVEFAVTLQPLRLGFLQVRPMVVSNEEVSIGDEELHGEKVLVSSDTVLGNGIFSGITDVVYVKPSTFEAKHTPQIVRELETINRTLFTGNRPYLLLGFGRWGSSDQWLGIPVNWGQVCGARVIVEATLPTMDVELSQGSHFFHNLTSFKVGYFCVPHCGDYKIRWELLDSLPGESEMQFVRHIRLHSALTVKVDGRRGKGVIILK